MHHVNTAPVVTVLCEPNGKKLRHGMLITLHTE